MKIKHLFLTTGCAALAAATAGAYPAAHGNESAMNTSMHYLPLATVSAQEEETFPDDYYNIITEQPEGELVVFYKDGTGFAGGWNSGGADTQVGILAADGSYYFKDILTTAGFGTWVKAEKQDESTYVIKKQPVTYQRETLVYLCDMTKGFMDDGVTVTWRPSENTDIILKYTDGTFTYQAAGEDHMMGLWWSGDMNIWTGFGDCESVLSPITDEPVAVPDNLEFKEYTMDLVGVFSRDFKMTRVAFDGDDVYVNHLPGFIDPKLTIKGHKEGGKIVFKDRQYLGYDASNEKCLFLYGMIADYSPGYKVTSPSNEDIVFDYDEATGQISTEGSFCLSKSGEAFASYAQVEHPVMKPFTEVAAVPANMVIGNYLPFMEAMGAGMLFYTSTCKDVDGNDINPEKTFYRIYGDGELLTIYADEYPVLAKFGLDECTDLPIWFDDNGASNYSSMEHSFTFYFRGIEQFGLQVVYRGGGEEHLSDIVYTDGSIIPAGINNIESEIAQPGKECYYDLNGRVVVKPSKGIYIKRDIQGKVSKVIL